MSRKSRFLSAIRLTAIAATVAIPVGGVVLMTGSVAHAGPAGYAGAPDVDPRLDGVPGAATAPRFGSLTDRELRAEAVLLRSQEQSIRNARAALAAEFARRGENPIAEQPTD
jgi:hypothetical protein